MRNNSSLATLTTLILQLHKKLFPLHKKMKFSIKDFFSKCEQIRSFLLIWSLYWRNPYGKLHFFVECSSVTTLTTLIFMNTWDIHFQDCVTKNGGHWLRWLMLIFNTTSKIISSLTTLNTLIIKTTLYIVLSLTTLTSLIHSLRWQGCIQDYVKYSVIVEYTDYTVMKGCYW